MDVLTPEQRRFNMSRVRSRNTKPEMLIRQGLHRDGLRFRLHAADLPGRPDLVFPRFRAVIFINGCFWHGHACPAGRLPQTRRAFWEDKIGANRARDQRVALALLAAGWRVLTVWECSLKGPGRRELGAVLADCGSFLRGHAPEVVIGAFDPPPSEKTQQELRANLT